MSTVEITNGVYLIREDAHTWEDSDDIFELSDAAPKAPAPLNTRSLMTRRDRGLNASEYAERQASIAAFNRMFPTRLPSHMQDCGS